MFKSKRIYMIPVIGFIFIIMFFALLFLLPISTKHGVSFFNAIFISTSAVSGTGYSTIVISENFTIIGQIFLVLAIQVGALGFMLFYSFILLLRHKKLKLSDTLILSNEINFNNHSKVRDKTISILKYAFGIEFLGAMLLSIKFIPEYGVIKGFWYGIFHSVSSFANAGFDILGNNSFIKYTNSLYVNMILIGLMFCGGLGYFVLSDIYGCLKNRKRKLQVHSKIILLTTFWLVLVSTILFKIALPECTILQALFNTISARNTGIATIDFSNVNNATKFVISILMFIGGAPGSNAGGIRLTNFFILALLPFSVIKNEEIIIFYRKIDMQTVKKSISMILVYIFLVFASLFILLLTDSNINFMNLTFNLISAFSNTGFGSIDINILSSVGKFLFIFMMYIGRIGPLTFFTMIALKSKQKLSITYANADLML